jgi:ubiquinone/menaquinone biosynthesis C-methylase UbiE
MFFGQFENSTLQTLDIREVVRPDVVADICDMPHIANGSFDIVFACHVLSHVYDLAAGLSEINRILKPGGVFINHEPIIKGQPTKDITDVSEICRHYGAEAYEKHRVGRFRTLGEIDIKSILSSHFEVDLRRVIDNPSGMEIIWTISRKIVACSTV